MKFQLVLQWPASSIKDYDTMVDIESLLIDRLSSEHEVDGHDAGSGEVNIFIHTNQPESAFAQAKTILGTQDFWVDARVAYRESTGNQYTVLWPKDLDEFKII